MKVKVGNTWYDGYDIPIAVRINSEERKQIEQLPEPNPERPHNTYAQAPVDELGWADEEFLAWMQDRLEAPE